MKKLFYLLVVGMIAGGLLTGCEEEGENEGPAISNLKFNNVAVTNLAASELAGTYPISFTATDDNEVKTWNVKESGSSVALAQGNGEGKASVNASFNYTLSTAKDLVITVVDDEDVSTVVTLKLTVDLGLNSFTEKLFGAQDNATDPSFMDASAGTLYNITNAKASSNLIDIVYFYGATNFATLAAPADTDAQTVFGGTSGISSWTTRNTTTFKVTTLTPTQFVNMTKKADVIAAYDAVTSSGTKANSLTVGKIVAFKTANNEYGLAHVAALTTGATGSMTVDVKVGKVNLTN